MENKQEKPKKKKVNWNTRSYLLIGLIAFLVLAFSIAFFFFIFRYQGVSKIWDEIMGILQPIIIGIVFAYLINPIVNWEEKYLLNWFGSWMKKPEKAKKTARGVSVIGAIVFVVIIITILLNMVIPELYKSIERMIIQLPGQADAFVNKINHYISMDNQFSKYLEIGFEKGVQYFETWLQTDVLPQIREMITSVTTGVISVVKLILNIVLGIIVSVYVLMSKETFLGQAKKLVYAFLPIDKGNVVIEIARKSNEIFGGFISGKILDSVIIGILCFVSLWILKMPYALLVSVIVGCTNVVPFFGPFIGAIPSTILITLTNPIQGIYFIIFVLVLQQLDGNVIGPKILGESTGLSSFWVIFAILISGGLFGFVGMVLGVPIFATIYYLIQRMTAYILTRKGLPTETECYVEVSKITPETRELDYRNEKQETKTEE